MQYLPDQNFLLVLNPSGKVPLSALKLPRPAQNTHVHLLSIIDNVGGFDLNKIMLTCKQFKEELQNEGYICTSEVIKVTKGNHHKEHIIRELKEKMNAQLIEL